jgi:phosphoserine phosphatase RsbU/P
MLSQTVATEHYCEWALACDVQQRFMRYPAPPANTVDYGGRCRQVQQLGGDCYDFLHLGDGRLALSVGDASGKGLSAALMIANVQSSARTASLLSGVEPAAVLDVVNRQVYASSSADRYATLFYGVFDAATRTLRYVNAGHNPPIVIHRDGSTKWLETGGAPVGMFPSWPYEEGTVRLDSGDVVIGYTDGVVEATNPSGEEWGVEGLRRATFKSRAQSADDLVDSIFAAMDEYSRGHQSDDSTVVVMRVP